MFRIVILTLISSQIAQAKGSGKFESECVKYLKSSSIEEVKSLGEQLMLSQTPIPRLEQHFNVKYIDHIKADLGIGPIKSLNSLEVSGYGPSSDPSFGKYDDHGKPVKAFYINVKNKKQHDERVRIEIFTKDPEIEIIAKRQGLFERYVLSQEGDRCMPVQKLSGTNIEDMKSETDVFYCADMIKFYNKFSKYENIVSKFNYDKCEKDPECNAAAKEIYESRYVKRPAAYLQSSARPAMKLAKVKDFDHAKSIKREYSDQCTGFLNRASEQIASKKVQSPAVVAPDSKATDVKSNF